MKILIEARDLDTGEVLNSFSIPEEVHSQELGTLLYTTIDDFHFYSNNSAKGLRPYIENKAREWADADDGNGFANVRQHPATVYYVASPTATKGEEFKDFYYKFFAHFTHTF